MITKYIILFLYFSILFLIGYFASKRIKNIEDYYVGGKKLNFWVVAFSAIATGESAWLLLGPSFILAIIMGIAISLITANSESKNKLNSSNTV